MKPKTVILMVVAVGCGLAASFLTSRLIAERGEPEKVGVLVARHDIPMGTLLTDPEKLFEEKGYTKGEEPRKAIRSLVELKGHRLTRLVSAEQFVTADDLIDKTKGLEVEPGKRAFTLNVNAASGVAGFVQPHSHVDIISAVPNANGGTTSKTILENILVLALDQSPKPPDGQPAVLGSTVTVQVTPKEAEELAGAQRTGTISLCLRGFGDETVTAAPVLDDPKPASPDVQPMPARTHTIELYNGDKHSSTTFVLK
jgi:pilus assembly protein CpaB